MLTQASGRLVPSVRVVIRVVLMALAGMAALIAAALLIIYVFDRVIGGKAFWQAALGSAFAPEIPLICKSYLELLACYLIFVGSIGLALTLARMS